MKKVWDRQLFVSLSFLGGMIARSATDGETLYVASNPGVLYAFDGATGNERWHTPLFGVPMRGGNVALANGVVYYTDDYAARAFDAATGSELWASPYTFGASVGSGIAVAGHHIVVNHYGRIAAYRLRGAS
jgi:outer membrane protein assembly factor BamB